MFGALKKGSCPFSKTLRRWEGEKGARLRGSGDRGILQEQSPA